MYKIYDVECTNCGNQEEQFIQNNDFEPCTKCGAVVKRLYTRFNFKLVYNNKKDLCGWSFNNYGSSRYYEDVNKERALGKDVRPLKE